MEFYIESEALIGTMSCAGRYATLSELGGDPYHSTQPNAHPDFVIDVQIAMRWLTSVKLEDWEHWDKGTQARVGAEFIRRGLCPLGRYLSQRSWLQRSYDAKRQ
jgi:hypothetical protein